MERTILIVDDDPDFRELLCYHIKKAGLRVVEAVSGNSAFELIKNQKLDLVITDVMMPDGDGVELLERTRRLDPTHPPVIVLTGYSELTEQEAFKRGASALFSKPFNRTKLIETVFENLH